MNSLKKTGLLLICNFIFGLPSGFSQTEEDTIKQTVLAYFKTTQTLDMEASVEYIHPAIFELVPKEKMIELMKQSFIDPDILLKMDSAEVLKVSPILEDNKIRYGLVNYSFLMHMTMLDDGKPMTDTDSKSSLMFTYNMLKNKYGEKKVRLEAAKGTIHILSETSLFAIKAPEFDGWKFLENKDNMTKILDGVIPESVLKQLLTK